jgi:hypothetical protein
MKLQTFEFEGISVEIIEMRGNSSYSPLHFPFKIVNSIILFIQFFTESLVLFQNHGELMFRRIMIDIPIFNIRTCSGMPGKSCAFKN